MRLPYKHCVGCSATSQAVPEPDPCVWSGLLDSRLTGRVHIISDQEAQRRVYCP